VAGGRHGGLGVHRNRLAMAVAAAGMNLAVVTGQSYEPTTSLAKTSA